MVKYSDDERLKAPRLEELGEEREQPEAKHYLCSWRKSTAGKFLFASRSGIGTDE
jgi:hypothetical protein